MRHIYNGGSSDTSGSFDKDEAWSEVMEAGTEAGTEAGGVAEGVVEKGGGQRWVMTDPMTMMPDTMCVDLSLTSLLACIHASIFVLVLNITRMYFSNVDTSGTGILLSLKTFFSAESFCSFVLLSFK